MKTPFLFLGLALLMGCASSQRQPSSTAAAPAADAPPTTATANPAELPFRNSELPIDQRVDDLVSRLTLPEKVSQMLNASPAIDRLGIPAYNWWNEALHGVARTSMKTTVFPQAIALAATFDQDAMLRMATITSDEARAVHHEYARRGERGIYQGLTFWTPNINIFRDPRWGRGQETYGEDPYLTGQMGQALVKGFQGDDPKYLKITACAKHFAVHSGPEPSRHEFNAQISNYDLWDTYLPAFRDLIVDAKVAGVMCAYNAYAGQPCCGSDKLMNEILYDKWKFQGYVTSDCDGLNDFWQHHKTDPDAATAAANAVLHGTDIECATGKLFTYNSLLESVQKGLITEKQLDVSVKRLYKIRFQLGMFDPVEQVKYAQIPMSVVESAPHQAHALKMARESVVLLKNERNTLPLRKNLKKLVVLGPNADNDAVQLGNYNGFPTNNVTPLEGIRAKVGPGTQVTYIQGVDYASNIVYQAFDINKSLAYNGQPGFKAEYYKGTNLEGQPVATQQEAGLDRYLANVKQEIVPGLPSENISARYQTTFTPTKTEELALQITGDDGYRLFVNNKLVLDNWKSRGVSTTQHVMRVTAGQKLDLRLEYLQTDRRTILKFTGAHVVPMNAQNIRAQVKDADAVVFVGGISPRLEGEEMKVNVEGFSGGDRTSIALPKVQTELLKVLHATGKPVVFVMMTGSAIGCPWEAQNVPAIINSWYGGQATGTALADVLFGDYNPAGRLPVTFYKSESQLPPFDNYDMAGRTYRYFQGTPLFPFGHGLSFTTFQYSNLKVPAATATGQPVTVSVEVQNTGKRAGDEVVQLYVRHPDAKGRVALHALEGFHRVPLQAGEKQTVQFTLTPRQLSVLNTQGQRAQQPGKVQLFAGGGQPLSQAVAKKSVVQANLTLTGSPVAID
ncbi:glycoside hydrolase family 3 C-terminal domain-containing protein [Hymenobacter cellulosivorans]|uniref:Glycoside hydrolase family 3 C-terminal domain-containing protein n=1 Tax=Hymenobacter cellulosivorans TaxID=2932249 RepID=A0ABY4FG03_9BACT|nr:glycoside hydrolase family 3 C-terminal domain-containing protein [Hymenobacter cellulosivorans]UOQ54884.1 glycoside hydrolase family 3 C-terminal domain-containing protein [Hymenobacter cellulosivorans]